MYFILPVFNMIFGVLGVNPSGEQPFREYSLRGYAQGTSYNIKYYYTDSLDNTCIDKIFNYLDSNFSLYKSYSQIVTFNQVQKGIRIDSSFAQLIKMSSYMTDVTEGAFDISIRPLSELWGFGTRAKMTPPAPKEVKNALKWVGQGSVYLKGDSLLKRNAKTAIDLDGIAQGYSVDLIVNFLIRKGIKSFMVELGGEVRTMGLKPDGSDWIIALDNNYINNKFNSKKIVLRNRAVTTSGSLNKYVRFGDTYFSHILDPRTGYPVNNGVISVTVLAENATIADALDNALMVMGVDQGLKFLNGKPGWEAYFLYKKENGSISDTSTTGFNTFLVK